MQAAIMSSGVMMNPLERETETFERELPKLLDQEGKFVLIQGDRVVGVYDSYPDALKVGYNTFGFQEFMVQKIEPPVTSLEFRHF